MSSLTSARDCAIIYKLDRRKYPRGRRGSPAKGVAGLKPGEGSNPSFRATSERISLRSDVFFCEAKKDVIHSVTSVPPFKPEAGGFGFVFWGRVCFVTFALSSKTEAEGFGFVFLGCLLIFVLPFKSEGGDFGLGLGCEKGRSEDRSFSLRAAFRRPGPGFYCASL